MMKINRTAQKKKRTTGRYTHAALLSDHERFTK